MSVKRPRPEEIDREVEGGDEVRREKCFKKNVVDAQTLHEKLCGIVKRVPTDVNLVTSAHVNGISSHTFACQVRTCDIDQFCDAVTVEVQHEHHACIAALSSEPRVVLSARSTPRRAARTLVAEWEHRSGVTRPSPSLWRWASDKVASVAARVGGWREDGASAPGGGRHEGAHVSKAVAAFIKEYASLISPEKHEMISSALHNLHSQGGPCGETVIESTPARAEDRPAAGLAPAPLPLCGGCARERDDVAHRRRRRAVGGRSFAWCRKG